MPSLLDMAICWNGGNI